jgi:membrane-bound inhibitor of C-type lysozyme
MRTQLIFCTAITVAVAAIAGCEHMNKPTKEEEQAAKNTFACQLVGERLIIRFESGEARMLTAGNEKITLYQIPSPSGVRYSNGTIELRGKGKGMDLTLIENGASTALEGCQQYTPPKP